jgi:hypothetical protein
MTSPAQLRPLAEAGLTLIPLHNHAATKDGRPLGKSPRDRAWQAKDYAAFDAVAHMESGDNVGVRLDGLIVCDADPRNYAPGDDPLARAAADDLLPDGAPRVATGGGGAHVYMRLPPDAPLTVETLPGYQGLEFKRGPKQVVAPGSVHPSGRAYAVDPFDDDFRAIPDAPPALLGKLQRPEPAGGAEWATHEPEQVARMLSRLDPRPICSNGVNARETNLAGRKNSLSVGPAGGGPVTPAAVVSGSLLALTLFQPETRQLACGVRRCG